MSIGGRFKFLCALLALFGSMSCTPRQSPMPVQAPTTAENGNLAIESFSKAKTHIYSFFAERPKTFYCDCRYEQRAVVHSSCGYQVRQDQKRASRVEIEHVVPAHAFGQSFPEWRDGHSDCVSKKGKAYRGRRCARKVSQRFRRMEADLFNLQPAVGEVNADRKHYSMGIIPGEHRAYGQCDVEVSDRRIEPRPSIRGDIARTYLYMNWAYPGRGIVGKSRAKLFRAWDREDPVDQWEYT